MEDALREIQQLDARIAAWEQNVEDAREAQRRIRRKLWTVCDHAWERDPACAFDDPCPWRCRRCRLWRDRSLYR